MWPVKPEREDHKKVDLVLASVMAFAAARTTTENQNWYGAGRTLRD